jgi:hypothetical protein
VTAGKFVHRALGAGLVAGCVCAGPVAAQSAPGAPGDGAAVATAAGVAARDAKAVVGRVAVPSGFTARAGLTIAAALAGRSAAEQRAFGRVLDPLPFLDAVNARAASHSGLALARSEYERVTRLHGRDLNASTREVEAARDVLRQATLAAAGAEARVRSTWGDAAGREDLEAIAQALTRGSAAVARVDLPPGRSGAGYSLAALATGDGAPPLAARLLGAAPATDPLLQGAAYLLLIERDPPAVGASLLATFTAELRRDGALVPAAAIVWRDGVPCVYVEVEPDVFERRAVPERLAAGDDWLVASGVAAGERVVASGAQQLLSAEILDRDE